MVLDSIFGPVLRPLLNFNPALGILIISFVITLGVTLAYKYLTNQENMKQLKDQQKEYQKKMKELRSNPQEMMKVQKEAMKLNMDYMKQSLKPSLFTMLPILIIFSWLSASLAFEPIYPGETYSITANFAKGVSGVAKILPSEGTELVSEATQTITDGQVKWNLKSTAGEHLLTIKQGDTEQTKEVLITKDLKTAPQVEKYKHSDIEQISIGYNKLKPLPVSIFGWQPGWLAIYIIASVIFSIVIRKLLKIH